MALMQDPARRASAVTPSDSTVLNARAVYVGGAGDLVVELPGNDGAAVTFVAVPAGSLLPIRAVRIRAATTATSVVALY